MFSSGPHAKLSQRVLRDSAALTPSNTGKAYEPKKKEFHDFCKVIHADKEVSTRFTVTEEKLFCFLYYQANRQCRKRGSKKRKAPTEDHGDDDDDDNNDNDDSNDSNNDSNFDEAEYREIIRRGENNLPHDYKKPQFDTVNQYYSAVIEVWKSQNSNGSNNISKETLRSDRVIK